MGRLTIPSNVTFLELIGLCEEYSHPLRQMWTSFWLKAAAVHDGTQWTLCYFALVGRWSEAVAAEEVRESSAMLCAVSKRLTPSEAWSMLTTLVTEGVVALSDSVLAVAPDRPVPTYAQYQESVQSPLNTTVDVVEQAQWRWLYLYGTAQWLTSAAHADLQRSLQPDLERYGVSDYRRFINTRFGGWEYRPGDPSFDVLQYHLDLPLALIIEPGIPNVDTHQRPLVVACRLPLTLEALELTSGNRPSTDSAPTPITNGVSTEDGWASGSAVVPISNGKVWVSHPLMHRILLHEMPLPTPAAQANEALAYVYRPRKPHSGAHVRDAQLLEGKDDVFEVALINAIARLGVPVLFAGQLKRQEQAASTEGDTPSASPTGSGKKASGPATPGFDLIALDHAHRRAVLISAKGITHSPGDDDIERLLKGVVSVGHIIAGWYVTGLIACHASATMLVRIRARGDVVVWGQDELELLSRADVPDPILRLLWTPPGGPELGILRTFG